jgi:hypothetical protein
MPIATEQVRETREMRLISRILFDANLGGLPVFLAERRLPGAGWRSWEQITIDLHTATGETITREGIRRWARKYGIPEDTRQGDGPKLTGAYRRKVERAGIQI